MKNSIWNGKPAPSIYLHKQLDVTRWLLKLDFDTGASYVGGTAMDWP